MKRLSLAILGTAAILTSALAGPALAKGTTARDANDKQVTAHKTHKHMQRHTASRNERFRSGNALATGNQFDRPVGPIGAAGAIVGEPPKRQARSPPPPSVRSTTALTIITATAMEAATGRAMRRATTLPVRPAPRSAMPTAGYTPASN